MKFSAIKHRRLWIVINEHGERILENTYLETPTPNTAMRLAQELNERKAGTGTYHIFSAFCQCVTCKD